LSGSSGQAPKPFYDPLKFWIEEAHIRGLEVHAWINPYRITMNEKEPIHPNHPVLKHPEWLIQYDGQSYFNPGLPDVQSYICHIVSDIVSNYDVNGIHMDDYFYPYPKKGIVFPDSATYLSQCDTSQLKSIDDWRRNNVNITVEAIHKTIKKVKPWVVFGISPFGVWRNQANDPEGSDTKAGITNYDHLYADVKHWMAQGWLDYVAPQIYWEMTHPTASFKTLSEWWDQNSFSTPVYIGHAIYKINSNAEAWKHPEELPKQLRKCRQLASVKGNIFFRYQFLNDKLLGLQDSLTSHFYKHPALTPQATHGLAAAKTIPIKKITAGGRKLKWKVSQEHDNPTNKFVVYSYVPNEKFDTSSSAQIYAVTGSKKIKLKRKKRGAKQITYFRVAAIDQYGNEGTASGPIRMKL
jgi:uncharacterized lipoprotein YddW (UPF0748 family)